MVDLVPKDLEGLIDFAQTAPDKGMAQQQADVVANVAEVVGEPQQAEAVREEAEALPDDEIVDLTAEDILNSEPLQKAGALEGDKIVNGELRRIVSDEPRGDILTNQDIILSPELLNAGAEAGDMIDEEGNLIKSGDNDPWRNIMYDYTKASSMVENLTDYLNSQFPLPEVTFDITDPLNFITIHGNDPTYQAVLEMTPQQRRDFFVKQKQDELAKMREDFEPTGSIVGTLVGSSDPSLLLPLGRTLARQVVGGGLYGSAFEASGQLAQKGEITEPADIVITGGLGAATVPAITGAVNVGKKTVEALTKPVRAVRANKVIDKASDIVSREIALGRPVKEAFDTAQKELNLTPQQLTQAATLADRKIKISPVQQRAKEVVEDEMANDSVGLATKSTQFRDFINVLSTEVDKVSKALGGKLKKFEADVHVKTGANLKQAETFISEMRNLSDNIRREVSRHLYNRNFDAAKALAGKYSQALARAIDEDVAPMLSRFADDLEAVNPSMILEREGYMPRYVNDLDGLLNSLGTAKKTQLERAFQAVAKSQKKPVEKLTDPERADIINKILQGYKIIYSNDKLNIIAPAVKGVSKGKSVLAKREIDVVTPEMMRYYATADEALAKYIRRTTEAVEKMKFLGRNNAKTNELGMFDYDESIGAMLNRELKSGAFKEQDFDRLDMLLKSRFGAGEQGLSDTWSTLRDLGYLGTIADPLSALVQLQDLATAGALYGFRNTIAAMIGKKNIKIADVALERISAEFENPNLTAKYLDKAFGWVGFKAVDRLGKETLMNASLNKLTKMAQTATGKDKIREKYRYFLGDDMEATIADLENGVVSPNVKALALDDLAGVQPVTRSEQAVNYLRFADPQTRLLYMLKSFTIKQYDLVRREIYGKIKRGEYYEAAKMSATLGAYWAVAGASVGLVKDFLLGRDIRPEAIPTRALWSLLGVFGLSQYTGERYLAQGDWKGAIINYVAPATPIIDAVISTGTEVLYDPVLGDGEIDGDKLAQNIKVLPGGDLMYNWFFGGAEKYNEREEAKIRREEREAREEALR